MSYDDFNGGVPNIEVQNFMTVKCALCGKLDCVEHTAPAQAECTSYRLLTALDCYKPVAGLPPPPGREPHICPKCHGLDAGPCHPCGGTGIVWEPLE